MKQSQFIRVLLIVCLIAVHFAFSQSDPSKKGVNELKQDPVIVKANLSVTDASGRLVEDLKLDQLKLFEDGIPQTLTYFEKKGPIVNLGIVIDNSGSMRESIDKLRDVRSRMAKILLNNSELFVVRFVSKIGRAHV